MNKLQPGAGSITPRGKSWRVSINIDGLRIRQTYATELQATDALQEFRDLKAIESLRKRGFGMPKREKMLVVPFNQLAEEVLNHGEKVMTPKSFKRFFYTVRRNLAPYFRDTLLSDVTAKMIEDYKLKRLDEVKPVTVRNELKILRSMLHKAIKWKYLRKGENPMDDVDRIKVAERDPMILTPEQVRDFFDGCSADFLPLAMIYYFAGLRKSEAFNLTWDDIQFDDSTIRIRGEVSKNKRTRIIPMNSKLRDVLLVQRSKYGTSPWVFPGLYGKQRATCQNAFRIARKKAGIHPTFRLHDMRHTWASHLLHAGVDPKLIQEWAGWHSIKMLDRYGHPDRRGQAEKINRLG